MSRVCCVTVFFFFLSRMVGLVRLCASLWRAVLVCLVAEEFLVAKFLNHVLKASHIISIHSCESDGFQPHQVGEVCVVLCGLCLHIFTPILSSKTNTCKVISCWNTIKEIHHPIGKTKVEG